MTRQIAQLMITREMVLPVVVIPVTVFLECAPPTMLSARELLVCQCLLLFIINYYCEYLLARKQVLIKVLTVATRLRMFEETSLVTVATQPLLSLLALRGIDIYTVASYTFKADRIYMPNLFFLFFFFFFIHTVMFSVGSCSA